MKRATLPSFRLYDLRHTFATQLLANSTPITDVSAQLGHAKPTLFGRSTRTNLGQRDGDRRVLNALLLRCVSGRGSNQFVGRTSATPLA